MHQPPSGGGDVPVLLEVPREPGYSSGTREDIAVQDEDVIPVAHSRPQVHSCAEAEIAIVPHDLYAGQALGGRSRPVARCVVDEDAVNLDVRLCGFLESFETTQRHLARIACRDDHVNG
jgi:hypothetical protein